MKKTKVKCGKAHAGNKNLERIAAGFRQCVGCGMCYTEAQVSAAKAAFDVYATTDVEEFGLRVSCNS